jgi:hypothetical protein
MIAARNNLSLVPSIKILIEETAGVLERIGNIPSHRKGTSALFGRHLREVVRNTASSLNLQSNSDQSANIPLTNQNSSMGQVQNSNQGQMPGGLLSFEPLLFSAMSDDQIVEAINNAGDQLEAPLPNFQLEDNTGLDWLDWFNTDFAGS